MFTTLGNTELRETELVTAERSSSRPTGIGDLTERCAHEGLYIFGRVLVSSHQLRIKIRVWDWLLF